MQREYEWVVLPDRRLAWVLERNPRGLKVKVPNSPETDHFLVQVDHVEAFNPADYPVQMSHQKRTKLKQSGIQPKDEIERVCNKCFTLKPVSEFATNQTRKDGSSITRPTCKTCRVGITGVNKKNHSELLPAAGEWWVCPICRKPGIVSVTVKCVVDHDHLTGEPREAICDSCNTGLGRFRNGKDYLVNAMDYLRKHGAIV